MYRTSKSEEKAWNYFEQIKGQISLKSTFQHCPRWQKKVIGIRWLQKKIVRRRSEKDGFSILQFSRLSLIKSIRVCEERDSTLNSAHTNLSRIKQAMIVWASLQFTSKKLIYVSLLVKFVLFSNLPNLQLLKCLIAIL